MEEQTCIIGLPCGSAGKESACNVGDLDLIPGWEDPLEKGKAAHSSILAWRIPWTEEPGGLQSMGSQRVRFDWVTKHSTELIKMGPWSNITTVLLRRGRHTGDGREKVKWGHSKKAAVYSQEEKPQEKAADTFILNWTSWIDSRTVRKLISVV